MNTTVEQVKTGWGNSLKWFLIISFLLHLLLFGAAYQYKWFQPVMVLPKEDKKIVFDLQPDQPKQVIETPNKPSEAPKEARLYSDKNMRAQNPQSTAKHGETPFSAGRTDIPVMPEKSTPEEMQFEENPPAEKPAPERINPVEEPGNYYTPSNRSFSREALLGKKSPSSSSLSNAEFDSREFSVEDMGGFSFNTYNWNFAPYLLYLKKRIQRHIFPPPAFTKMGIIDGKTVLRFYIAKDGTLLDLKILNYEGHSSLMETSVNAVNGSAPFRALPGDFPEDVLEVTGTFVYNIYR